MGRLIFILFFSLLSISLKGQENNFEKIIFQFKYFKYPNTEYVIDYTKNELTCKMKYNYRKYKDSIWFQNTYKFTDKEFEKLNKELNKDVPHSIITKSENYLHGGGFVINYLKRNKDTSKIIIRNPERNKKKYDSEFNKIDTFFEFAYSVVKDSAGVNTLDNTYRPYFRGLPIRKISDNPLEYKIWGSISGNASWNDDLIIFLDSLPKDRCVIIDCSNELSYAWQEDILRLYIIKNSNLNFVNNHYLKYSREYLFEIRDKIKEANNNPDELSKLENITTYHLYTSNPAAFDKWMDLPEELIFTTVNEIRKKCH